MKGRLTAFLFVLAFSVSCGNEAASVLLDDVESYIQERPDSALATLRTIDATTLVGKAQRAKYSLLYTMALDKNYIDTTDISVIQPALEYYSKHDYPEKKGLTYFYAGRISENAQDYANAIVYYNKALENTKADDYKYNGLINYYIANSYHLSFNFEEELEYHKKALSAFEKYGDEKYIEMSLFGLANAFHNNWNFRKCDSLYNVVISRGDSLRPLALSAKLSIADNFLKSGVFDVKKVYDLYEHVLKNGGRLTLEDYYEYAYVLMLLGEGIQSDNLIKTLSSYPDSHSSLWWKYKIEQARGNHKKAEELLHSSIIMQDDIVKEKLRQSIFKAQSENYKYETLSAKQGQIILRQRFAIVIIIFLIVILLMIFFYKQRKKLLLKEKERLLLIVDETNKLLIKTQSKAQIGFEEISRLEMINIRQQEKVADLQKMYVELYKKQFSEICKYCDESFVGDPDNVTQKIVKSVSKAVTGVLSEISSHEKTQAKFEQRINKDTNNILKKIRIDYPNYSDEDLRFISLVIAGFDATSISVLMGITGENARVKKHRIKRKLLNDKGPNAALYSMWIK